MGEGRGEGASRDAWTARAGRLLRILVEPLSTPGLLVGTLFFAFSLTPSLLPRPLGAQGLISGLSLAAGYGIGVAWRWTWGFLELPLPERRRTRMIQLAAAVVCVGVAWGFLMQAARWQDDLRVMMGLDPDSALRPYALGLLTLALFSAVVVLARLFRETFRFLAARLEREVPRRVAQLLGAVLAAAIFWTVAEGVIFSAALRVADASYRQLDALAGPEDEPPADPLRTGSTSSRITWASMGRQGRHFVRTTPSAAEIARIAGGEGALEPIRVYVGRESGESPEDRARLALAELIRVGGFDRELLVVVTPTGTGWVDPAAMEALEYLHRGNVATVAAQYSYLPSPLALLAEGAYGAEMARALFLAVYGHWSTLPAEARPRMYLHGLSLGALNSSLSFDLHDILADPFDGVLWSGPPFRTESWAQVTRDRDPGTPYWLPRYRDGAVVRFMNQDGGLRDGGPRWGPFRIAYLQHAGDPITFFSVETAIREPEWMREPRGPDVSPALRWFPLVTMIQLAVDMAVGGAPPGFGHTFAARDYLEAWHALTDPDGWDPVRLGRLRAHLGQLEAAREAEDGD